MNLLVFQGSRSFLSSCLKVAIEGLIENSIPHLTHRIERSLFWRLLALTLGYPDLTDSLLGTCFVIDEILLAFS